MRNRFALGFIGCFLATGVLAQPGFFGSSSGQFDAGSNQLLATVHVEAPSSGTLPQTFAMAFPEGVTTKPSTNVEDQQSEILSTWQDGSARIVQFTVVPTFTSGVPLDVEIYSNTVVEGTDLTPADIDAAAPTATVAFTGCTDVATSTINCAWTSSLASLDLTDPDEIWVQGPEMIEAIYEDGNGDLGVTYYVRLYAGGRLRVRIAVNNGFWNGTNVNGTDLRKSYTPTVTIGGTTVWTNGGSPFTHYTWTGWDQMGWIGGDPAVVVVPDTAALSASSMVPEYWKSNPDETTLNAMAANYDPTTILNWKADMGGAGYDGGIGVIPEQDAKCITSAGDPRACNSAIAHARAIAGFGIVRPDSTTKRAIKPSDWASWTAYGVNAGGGPGLGSTGLGRLFEMAHHPAPVYLSYLITGDPYFYRMQQYVAAACYLSVSQTLGLGVSRLIYQQSRMTGWCMRSLANTAAIAKNGDSIATDYLALLTNNITDQYNRTTVPGITELGIFYMYHYLPGLCWQADAGGGCADAPFEDFYWMLGLSLVDQTNVLADETNLHLLMDHYYPYALGFGGDGSSTEFCYNNSSFYGVSVANTNTSDLTQWFDTHREIYERSCAQGTLGDCEQPLTACSATLRGNVADTATYYYGYLFSTYSAIWLYPPLRAEAEQVINRYKAASNWSVVDGLTANTSSWFIGPHDLWN